MEREMAVEVGVHVSRRGLQPDEWLLKAGYFPANEKLAEDNIATFEVGTRNNNTEGLSSKLWNTTADLLIPHSGKLSPNTLLNRVRHQQQTFHRTAMMVNA